MNATPPPANVPRSEPPGHAPGGPGSGALAGKEVAGGARALHNGTSNGFAGDGTGGPPSQERGDFEALYQRHSREVWALAYARWMNADTAMDVTQEAFLRLWKKWEDGEAILNPRAWLLRVARNLAEDHAKSAFRRNGTHPPQTMNGVQAKQPLPLENMEREETFGQLRDVMEQLPPPDREILTLRYALEYDTGQIADLLNINATAVHMRLSRARQRLAERLKAQGVGQLP
jgi:RNA polymerase sigma-70 factor (ECF subfamily)